MVDDAADGGKFGLLSPSSPFASIANQNRTLQTEITNIRNQKTSLRVEYRSLTLHEWMKMDQKMTDNTSFSQRSIDFNNAGVRCVQIGEHRMAWDLFKGALEVKLAIERVFEANADVQSYRNSNTYIARAEAHLTRIESSRKDDKFFAKEGEVTTSPRMQSIATWEKFSADSSLYTPFLFADPISLGKDPDITTRRESAAIIFNLALTEHLKTRCCDQAISLYELSMTLLAGDSVDLLGISLMNNIGVWCYENGDLAGCARCMGHLVGFTNALFSELDSEQREGVQSNILWLAHPPCSASPAA